MKRFYIVSLIVISLWLPALCCDLNSKQPLTLQVASLLDEAEPREVIISNNKHANLEEESGVIQLHSSESYALLDRIDSWPTDTGNIDSILADPVAVDFNYDGTADALYLVDAKGLVWFVGLSTSGYELPVLIADLTASAARFEQPLQLVQYTNGGLGSEVMLLITASSTDGNDLLITLKHRPQSSSLTTFNDLADRSLITADEVKYGVDEDVWQQLQLASGWLIRLDRRVVTLPVVYAGVIYFSAAQTSSVQPDCNLTENAALQLYAVHLHHAGLVYAKRNWLIETISTPSFKLETNAEQQLQLVLRNEQQQVTVIDAMLAINALCADCVEELNATQFPKVIRLATFQSEADTY